MSTDLHCLGSLIFVFKLRIQMKSEQETSKGFTKDVWRAGVASVGPG